MKNHERFGLAESTISAINSVFLKYPKINNVLVYGSRAKGNFKSGSDIDLTIKSTGLSTTELLKIENELEELMLPYKIDLSLFNQIESSELIDHINRVGVNFYP